MFRLRQHRPQFCGQPDLVVDHTEVSPNDRTFQDHQNANMKPSGAWLVFPAYMVYVFGAEILEGLETSSGYASKRA